MADTEEKTYFNYLQFTENGTKYYVQDTEARETANEAKELAQSGSSVEIGNGKLTKSETSNQSISISDGTLSDATFTAPESVSQTGSGHYCSMTLTNSPSVTPKCGDLVVMKYSNPTNTSSSDLTFIEYNIYIVQSFDQDNKKLYMSQLISGKVYYYYSSSASVTITCDVSVLLLSR